MDQWAEKLSDASLERRRQAWKRRADEFVAGPIPVSWLAAAVAVSPTAAVVGLAVWFRSGCERSRTVKIGRTTWSRFHISRFQAHRALHALEAAGLVTVERHRGRNPVITIRSKGKRK